MRVNADHAQRVIVRFADAPWTSSPEPGIARKLLERDGDEIARATSIVHYAPGSAFPPHVHERGEEFLVLDGVFSDEAGDHVAGSYVRNPPGSRHRPFSRTGCTIFVKLRQFATDDDARKVIGPGDEWSEQRQRLHVHRRECVELCRLPGPATISPRAAGIEILVVEGHVCLDGDDAPRWTWWRAPAPSVEVTPVSPAVLWIKSGHLDVSIQGRR